jgi:hypothetical protein
MYTLILCAVGGESGSLSLSGVVTPLPIVVPLSDVEALVLDPLAAVAVGVLKAKVVVIAELLREDVICSQC